MANISSQNRSAPASSQNDLTKKAIIHGILAAGATFFLGFGVLFLLWRLTVHAPELPGLFDYLASAYGDSICLPILVGALVTYVSLYAPDGRHNDSRRSRHLQIIVPIISGLIGAGIQAKWLISNGTQPNWSIPRPHHFNAAGWYHAFFFITMFALLSYLLVQFLAAKANEKRGDSSAKKMIIQVIIWFAASMFLFLHSIDDYAGKLFALEVTLILCLFTVGLIYICGYRGLIIEKADAAPILSGIFSAYSIASLIYGGVHTNPCYVLSALMLLVILVVPNIHEKKRMILFYCLIAIPAVLLEMAISSQSKPLAAAVIFVFSISVPCCISICQETDGRMNTLRKGVLSAVILLTDISVLVVSYIFPNIFADRDLFNELINLLLVVAIPYYVKATFKGVIEAENNDQKEDAQKLQMLMYGLYAMVFMGALILIFCIVMPRIKLYEIGEFTLNKYVLLLILTSTAAVIILAYGGSYRKSKGYLLPDRNKRMLCVVLVIAYCSMFATVKLSTAVTLSDMQTLKWLNSFVLPAVVFSPIAIAVGFINNMSMIRGVNRPDAATKAAAGIIGIGAFICVAVALLQMMLYATVTSVIIYIVSVGISYVLLPCLIGVALFQEPNVIPITKNRPQNGIFQDGFLFSITTILSESITVFYLARSSVPVIQLLIGLLLLISLISWDLKYCISNNIAHYKQRYEECDAMINWDLPMLYTEDERQYIKIQLNSLRRHLTMQNVIAFAITMPYSIVLIAITVFEYGMSNEQGWKNLKYCFIPGESEDMRPKKTE